MTTYKKGAVLKGKEPINYKNIPSIRGTVRCDNNREFPGISGTITLASTGISSETITLTSLANITDIIAAINSSIHFRAAEDDGYIVTYVPDTAQEDVYILSETVSGTAAKLGFYLDGEHELARGTQFSLEPTIPSIHENVEGAEFISANEPLSSSALNRMAASIMDNVDLHDISLRRPDLVLKKVAINVPAGSPQWYHILSAAGGDRFYVGPGAASNYFKVLMSDGQTEVVDGDNKVVEVANVYSSATAVAPLVGVASHYNDRKGLSTGSTNKYDYSYATMHLVITNGTYVRFTDNTDADIDMTATQVYAGDFVEISGSSSNNSGIDARSNDGLYIVEGVYGAKKNVFKLGAYRQEKYDGLNPLCTGSTAYQGTVKIYGGIGTSEDTSFHDNLVIVVNNSPLPTGTYYILGIVKGNKKELSGSHVEADVTGKATLPISGEVQKQILAIKSHDGGILDEADEFNKYTKHPFYIDTSNTGDDKLSLEDLSIRTSAQGVYDGVARAMGSGAFLQMNAAGKETVSVAEYQQGSWGSPGAVTFTAATDDVGITTIVASDVLGYAVVGSYLKGKLGLSTYWSTYKIIKYVDANTLWAVKVPRPSAYHIAQTLNSVSISDTHVPLGAMHTYDMSHNALATTKLDIPSIGLLAITGDTYSQRLGSYPIAAVDPLNDSSGDDPSYGVAGVYNHTAGTVDILLTAINPETEQTLKAISDKDPQVMGLGTTPFRYSGIPTMVYITGDVPSSSSSEDFDGWYTISKIVRKGAAEFSLYLVKQDGVPFGDGGSSDRDVTVYFHTPKVVAGLPTYKYGIDTDNTDTAGVYDNLGIVGVAGYADATVVKGYNATAQSMYDKAVSGILGSAKGEGAYGVIGRLGFRPEITTTTAEGVEPNRATGFAGGFMGNMCDGALRADFSADMYYGNDYTNREPNGFGALITSRSHGNRAATEDTVSSKPPNSSATVLVGHIDTSTYDKSFILASSSSGTLTAANFFQYASDPVVVSFNKEAHADPNNLIDEFYSILNNDTSYTLWSSIGIPDTSEHPLAGEIPTAVHVIKQEVPRQDPRALPNVYASTSPDPEDYEIWDGIDVLRGGIRIRDGLFGLVTNHYAQRVGINSDLSPIDSGQFSLGEPDVFGTYSCTASQVGTSDVYEMTQAASDKWSGTDLGRLLTGTGGALLRVMALKSETVAYAWLVSGTVIPGATSYSVEGRPWKEIYGTELYGDNAYLKNAGIGATPVLAPNSYLYVEATAKDDAVYVVGSGSAAGTKRLITAYSNSPNFGSVDESGFYAHLLGDNAVVNRYGVNSVVNSATSGTKQVYAYKASVVENRTGLTTAQRACTFYGSGAPLRNDNSILTGSGEDVAISGNKITITTGFHSILLGSIDTLSTITADTSLSLYDGFRLLLINRDNIGGYALTISGSDNIIIEASGGTHSQIVLGSDDVIELIYVNGNWHILSAPPNAVYS